MSGGSKAVFLSYASQDAEAARKICEALRVAGIEVWFDQSELRGGDAWDQKIRRQIKECALFVPVISANTQARLEGYFRLEWKLAEDRSHLMARGKPFIVPVSVDGTTERDAHVPDSFLAVQWTALDSADAATRFARRLQEMLSEPTSGGARSPESAKTVPTFSSPASKGAGLPVARRKGIWISAAAAVVLVVAGFVAFRATETRSVSLQAPNGGQPSATRGPDPNPVAPGTARSIAVLPFANVSGDPENEYFADGITDELGGVLARVAGLNVTARTSVFYFKGKQVPSREIGEKLGVTYLVEGSVRRAGNRVRIICQLSRAADGVGLWTNTFDREINDAFAVQDEIANLVAKSISPQLRLAARTARLALRPEAYRLLQRANTLANRTGEASTVGQEARQCIEAALAIDAENPRAWAWAGQLYARLGGFGFLPAAVGYELARTAATKALALDPNLPEAHAVMARVHQQFDWNWAAAEASAKRALALASGNGDLAFDMGSFAQTIGRLEDSLRLFREAVLLDPLNALAHQRLGQILLRLDRRAEAEAQLSRTKELNPNGGIALGLALWLKYGAKEDADEWVEAVEKIGGLLRNYNLALVRLKQGQTAAAQAALDEFTAKYRDVGAYQIACIHAYRGDADAAFQWLETAFRQRDPGLAGIKRSEELEKLHGDPRWAAFLKKMGLLEERLQ